MKNLLTILFIISTISVTVTNAYEAQKGKIDMHGGKSDSLTSGKAFGMAMGLGAVLNKKGSEKKEDTEEKKFITIEKEETIEKIETIK